MKKILVLMTMVGVAGCSAKSELITPKPPQSNLVAHPMYKYHGVKVEPSHNWYMGDREGLRGNPKIRLKSEEGTFFANAKRTGAGLTANEINNQNSAEGILVTTEQVNSTSAVCNGGAEPESTLLGEWIVHFDSASKTPKDLDLDKITNQNINPKSVVITGHTDDKGNDLYNLELSKERANAVRNEVQNVWPDTEFKVSWHGECPRITPNVDSESRAQNRRVHIKAYGA